MHLEDLREPVLEDLKIIGLSICVVPLVWWAMLGLKPSLSIAAIDGVAMNLPYLKELFLQKGDWQKTLYRFGVQGGIKIHDVVGTLPLYQIAGWLGFTPTSGANLLLFFAQIVFSFLGIRAALDFAQSLSGSRPKLDRIARLGLILSFAFAPFLAWKIAYGHVQLFIGAFAFLSGVSLICAVRARTISIPLLVALFLAISHCFSSSGQQLLVYSVFFGMPLFLALLWPIRRDRGAIRSVLLAFLFCVAGYLAVFPRIYGMLDHVLGPDAARGLEGVSATYSYITGSLEDWFSSLPWASQLWPTSHRTGVIHEVNYPFGPWLVLFILYPWRRGRALGFGVSAYLLAALIFTLNAEPLSTLMLSVVPLLKAFRVPQRAMLIFAMVLPILAVGATLAKLPDIRDSKKEKKPAENARWIFAAVLIAVFFLPPELREFLSWSAAGVLTYLLLARKIADPIQARAAAAFAFLLLGVASVGGFEQRLNSMINPGDFEALGARAKAAILAQEPTLGSPLTRASLSAQVPQYDVNSAWMMGLSVLDGYWFPAKRYLQLVLALEGAPFQPTVTRININESFPQFEVMRQLYNVCCVIQPNEKGEVQVRRLARTAGPAWFSETIEREPSFESLALKLGAAGSGLADALKPKSWIVASDSAFGETDWSQRGVLSVTNCGSAQVETVKAEMNGQRLMLEVRNQDSTCPLVIATNYVSILKAYAGEKELRTFPANGALLGVMVPPGVREITVSPSAELPIWVSILGALGWVFLLLTSYLLLKTRGGALVSLGSESGQGPRGIEISK